MAKFSFRLQNVLDIKTKFEEQQKNQFMQAKQQLNLEEELLSQLYEQRTVIYQMVKESRKSTLKVRELLENQAHLKYIEERIVLQIEAVERAQKKSDKEQALLTNMMKERKTYEQLREKAFDEYKVFLQAEEMIEIDELTSYRYGQQEE